MNNKQVYKTRVTVEVLGNQTELIRETVARSFPEAVELAIKDASRLGEAIEVYARWMHPVESG